MTNLTGAQEMVLEYISGRLRRDGRSPSYGEICAHFLWSSGKSARDVVYRLEALGYVSREPRKHRSIRLTKKGKRFELSR